MSDLYEQYEPTQEQLADWEEWLDGRPPKVIEVARRLPPWRVFRLQTTGQWARVQKYDEHDDDSVTVTAACWYEWFPLMVYNVFGLSPDDLVDPDDYSPCDS